MKVLKFMTVAAMLAAFFAVVVMVSAASRTAGYDQFDAGTGSGRQFDGAATYKAKCVVCHGQKAEKKFDVSLADQQLIDIVLKGKKPEKPPNMPAYGEKGVTTEQAAALVPTGFLPAAIKTPEVVEALVAVRRTQQPSRRLLRRLLSLRASAGSRGGAAPPRCPVGGADRPS